MKLYEIVKTRKEKQDALDSQTKNYNKFKESIEKEIDKLNRLENIAENGINIELVQLAETVINVDGNPYGAIDGGGKTIAEEAIEDIANDCDHLKVKYFGNKTYSGYYQRCNCEYGFGPKHGGISDSIELKSEWREKELTEDQKDACIYYIKNYLKVKEGNVAV